MTANRTALRRRLALSTALCAAVFAATPAAAQNMPGYGTVTSTTGNPNVQVNNGVLDVKAGNNAIINWDKFSVSLGQRANFSHSNGPNAPNISILNRVQGSDPTNIFGQLASDKNVAVYIINPNGIVFGGSAQVNVGALVASTRNLTDDNDFLNGASSLRFTSNPGDGRGVVVAPGAIINTGGGGDLGDLVLLGGQVSSEGTLTAQGDIGLIAGEDITVVSSPNSPLAFAIDRGTTVSNAIYLSGNISGNTVTAGFFSKTGVANALLFVANDTQITATYASPTRNGIILGAGKTAATDIGGAYGENQAPASLHIGEGVTLKSMSSSIELTSSSNIFSLGRTYSHGLQVYSQGRDTLNSGNIEIGNIVSTDAVLIYGRVIDLADIVSTNLNISSFDTGAGKVTFNGNIAVSGLQNISNPGDIIVVAKDVAFNGQSYTATGKIDVQATGGSITGTGNLMSGQFGSGGGLSLTALQAIDASGLNLQAGLNGNYAISISTGDLSTNIKLGNIKGASLAGLTGRLGSVSLGDVDISGDFNVDASGSVSLGSVRTGGGFSALSTGAFTSGAITANGDATVTASDVTISGDVSARAIALEGRSVIAQKLTTASGTVVKATNGNADIKEIVAAGNVSVTADGVRDVIINNVKAGGNLDISAGGNATVSGAVDVGGNYNVTAFNIALGADADAEVHKAGGDIVLNAVNVLQGGQGLILNANRNASSTGKVSLKAAEIAFADDSTLIVGGDEGPGVGTLEIVPTYQIATKLGNIRAGAITGLRKETALSSVTLGNVDVVSGLDVYAVDFYAGNIKSGGDVSLQGNNVYTRNISAGGSVSLNGYTSIDGNIEAAGDVSAIGSNFYAGNIRSSGGSISITSYESLTAGNLFAATDIALALPSAGGSDNIRMGGAEAGRNLNVNLAGRGNVEIGGNIKAGGNVDISSGGDVKMADGTSIAANETSGSIKIFGHYGADLRSLSARDISLASDPGGEIYLRGDVKAATLDLQGGNVEQTGGGIITVGKLTGRDLDSVELTNANRISEISDFASSGVTSIQNRGGGLIVSGTITNASGFYIETDGALTLGSGSKISGDVVVLGGNRFINNAGSSAVTASGRWFIVTDAPDGNVYGGLNSGNTAIWDVDNSDGVPTGSRYAFRYQPTLTFTSTDYAKTYGDDIAALLAGHYTVSGLHAGVAGAFLGDTLADVISGSPLLTSLGATARASVAGGPYVIEIGQGSLTSLSGYKFAFNDAGRVTVGKKALTATVAVNDKTYDGTTQATGSFSSLNGLVQGDVVEVGGKLTFASKNAGTQKVTVENLGLAGADAGNYTVTISVPDQLSATIFKKAVSVQVAVDDKTYDGTSKANGRITGIDGKVASDDLTATGGSYTYGDKNAGTDKLVTISNIMIGGADAGNYEVTIPASVLADILKKAVTVNVSVDNKTYDQTTAATGRINGIDGVIAGDDVKATGGSYAFADKNAGKGKTVSVSGIQLSGGDLGNYDVTIPATVLAEILKRAVTITISVDGKTYDGTTDATGRITGMEGVLSGDQLTVTGGKFAFLDKNAGAGKAATANGFTYGGADAGNYEAVIAPGAMADIAKRAITVRANDATGYVFSPSTNLTYTVTQGSLAPGDAFTGALAREPGYVPGDYAIGLGTLSLSSNYDMTFEAGTFTLALGTPPLRQQVPDLYRSFELGGRAQAMRREPRALIWAQAFDCQSSTRNAELCQ